MRERQSCTVLQRATAMLLGIKLQPTGKILSLQLAPNAGILHPANFPFFTGKGMEQGFRYHH